MDEVGTSGTIHARRPSFAAMWGGVDGGGGCLCRSSIGRSHRSMVDNGCHGGGDSGCKDIYQAIN